MPYTTHADVAAILATEYSASIAPSLDPFIDTAHELVEDCCADAGYSDFRLGEIEKYLAAHFYGVTKARLESEGIDVIQTRIQSKVDKALELTHFGQTALLLDKAGGLAAAQATATGGDSGLVKHSVGVVWMGTQRDVYGTEVSEE